LAEVEPCPYRGRPQRRQLGLQRRPDGSGEPLRRLHHQVDEEGTPGQAELRALPVEVGDRLVHLAFGTGPYVAPPVEHPVDGGLAQPGLHGDLPNPVGVPAHRRSCWVFDGFSSLTVRLPFVRLTAYLDEYQKSEVPSPTGGPAGGRLPRTQE